MPPLRRCTASTVDAAGAVVAVAGALGGGRGGGASSSAKAIDGTAVAALARRELTMKNARLMSKTSEGPRPGAHPGPSRTPVSTRGFLRTLWHGSPTSVNTRLHPLRDRRFE